jgi:hypothetical protein
MKQKQLSKENISRLDQDHKVNIPAYGGKKRTMKKYSRKTHKYRKTKHPKSHKNRHHRTRQKRHF